MWIHIKGSDKLVNLDQVSSLYLWQDGARVYVRAMLPGGTSMSVSPPLDPDDAERRLAAIAGLLRELGKGVDI